MECMISILSIWYSISSQSRDLTQLDTKIVLCAKNWKIMQSQTHTTKPTILWVFFYGRHLSWPCTIKRTGCNVTQPKLKFALLYVSRADIKNYCIAVMSFPPLSSKIPSSGNFALISPRTYIWYIGHPTK